MPAGVIATWPQVCAWASFLLPVSLPEAIDMFLQAHSAAIKDSAVSASERQCSVLKLVHNISGE